MNSEAGVPSADGYGVPRSQPLSRSAAQSAAPSSVSISRIWSVVSGPTAARQRLEQAIGDFDSRLDLVLWMRLRLAAASLYLQVTPRQLDECRRRLDEAEPALALVGTPVLR